ncbi:MAG: hypothetical protein WAL68_18530 [Candidatus Binatus sp.]|jgi:hypothetical protein
MGMRIFFLAAGLILSGCATDQCASLTEPADIAACQANQRQANWRALAVALGGMSNGLGSMQGLAEQNQQSAQTLIDQTQQFPRFQPPESVQPVGVDQGRGSPAPYPNNLWSSGGLWNP